MPSLRSAAREIAQGSATTQLRQRIVYADGDAAATLLRPRRWSYVFVAFLYPFYIKSEVQLISVQLNLNIQKKWIDAEGQTVRGPSMVIRRQMATIRAL